MKNRVMLIVVGGLRSDALMYCGNPYVKELLGTSAANVSSKTVNYGYSRLAHTAIMYSDAVEYNMEIKKEDRLFDVIKNAGGKNSLFVSSSEYSEAGIDTAVDRYFFSGDNSDLKAKDAYIEYEKENQSDFSLIHFSAPHDAGHEFGFMSEEYLKEVNKVFDYIKEIRDAFPLRKMMVISDHGGHDKEHETSFDSDITIPIILNRVCNYTEKLASAEIIDIAPTVCKLLGIECPKAWKGETLL